MLTLIQVILPLPISISLSQNSTLSDEDIIRQITESKNPRMVDVLYERYADKVYRKCLSFVKDEALAEDLTHDIFIKLYFNLNSFKFKSKFSTWLYSVTYNFCIDYIRKSKKRRYLSFEDKQVPETEIDDRFIETTEDLEYMKTDRLVKILDLIKPKDKIILNMKYKEEMSIKEIQEVLKISESAVKMRIKRAKDNIKKIYEQQYLSK